MWKYHSLKILYGEKIFKEQAESGITYQSLVIINLIFPGFTVFETRFPSRYL